MASANRRLPSSKTPEIPRMPSRSSDTEDKTPPSSSSQSPPSVPPWPLSVDAAGDDALLLRSDSLTRPELLRRRSRRVKQLARYYRAQYWALMEEIKLRYREYYWKYGKSPFVEEEEGDEREGGGECSVAAEGSGENSGGQRLGIGFVGRMGNGETERRCAFTGCKSTAMALSSYCHQHILSDGKQKLYKACGYVIKSAQTGPVICGKPVLRAAVPSLCNSHFQMAQKHVSRALKKAGLNMTSAAKPAPKFHVIIAEYVHQIQAKRKEAQQAIVENMMIKEERAA